MTLDKSGLRIEWLKRRQALPVQRKLEASQALAQAVLPQGMIGSFASFRDEINTNALDVLLAQKKRLALPKVEKDKLCFYVVDDLERQLMTSSIGILEPIPSLCRRAEQLDAILVPGLAFDQDHYRLGYGKGYYDRFLAEHPILSIGIGFKEQLAEHLPRNPHDVPLQDLFLF